MGGRLKKSQKKGSRKTPKKARGKTPKRRKEAETARFVGKGSSATTIEPRLSLTVPVNATLQSIDPSKSPVFGIELERIDGETTIGDLIVVFPRTRDVLLKHGLRFDVEDAGYIYMTLSVFSALHGLKLNGLIQELTVASKEVPVQPPAQSLAQITPPQTA